MIAFLDFEASSLSRQSYPIEVAWVFEDGRSHSSLIKPAPHWTDWSDEAEAIHGITRAKLEEEGTPFRQIASEMLRSLHTHDLYASAPSWDGKWLSLLLRTAGLPRHALRLRDSDEAFRHAIRSVAGADLNEDATAALIEDAKLSTKASLHRALADAERELQRLRMVCRLATDVADQ